MRNNKGQALIEFVLVLPIFLLILISIIDFGNIMLKKYDLESDIDIISNMYVNGEDTSSYLDKNKLSINVNNEGNYTTITISKNVKIISPVLVAVLGSNYEISTEKSVLND